MTISERRFTRAFRKLIQKIPKKISHGDAMLERTIWIFLQAKFNQYLASADAAGHVVPDEYRLYGNLPALPEKYRQALENILAGYDTIAYGIYLLERQVYE